MTIAQATSVDTHVVAARSPFIADQSAPCNTALPPDSSFQRVVRVVGLVPSDVGIALGSCSYRQRDPGAASGGNRVPGLLAPTCLATRNELNREIGAARPRLGEDDGSACHGR